MKLKQSLIRTSLLTMAVALLVSFVGAPDAKAAVDWVVVELRSEDGTTTATGDAGLYFDSESSDPDRQELNLVVVENTSGQVVLENEEDYCIYDQTANAGEPQIGLEAGTECPESTGTSSVVYTFEDACQDSGKDVVVRMPYGDLDDRTEVGGLVLDVFEPKEGIHDHWVEAVELRTESTEGAVCGADKEDTVIVILQRGGGE